MTQSFSKVWIIGILAVVLAGGVFAWQYYWAPKSASSRVDTPTKVIQYIPTELPSETKEGSCWVNSLSAPRKGAWRCTVGNSISDPCFTISGSENLICNPNPITGDKGFLLKLTEQLPRDTSIDNSGYGWGWLIEFADGTSCSPLTGATGVINGKRVNYGCSDGFYVLGDLETGTFWKAEKVDVDSNLQTKSVEIVPIQRVWQ